MGNPKEEKALEDKGIKPGDFVSTKYRGGTREGVVERIAKTPEEHPHPPKVIFTNQRGKEVAHNPSTLEKKAAAEEQDEEPDE
ncbi:hypothetical protein COCSUDRAFT_61953 [Coccomyxa subellipsoidea C-169]|uniref:Hypervirulence associated protein TUDOR domain-containing protein n=1 Tax=Coccomyxa subellipsoidea (strain C-169) TaxID=574566 RepID=I0Z1K4_COCSC|nr:hypothetical protein COCSUDRAFT_61953 [Coccomyxa subellipsoidea C-169]EIE24523.1 hypothetical protein COCSUDRAFT_61953 [Coccomyxa subellipsoidea C-169]|eukprot:XP_005649067.1 hypothetical protein COCSUDRAFT_61953 [Coccomyxa subellipsoidea C-169]